MSIRTIAATLVMTAALSGLPPSRVAAQRGQTPADEPVSAEQTRERLHDVLGDYPPQLALVLRLDPTLLSNQAYLQPYSRLAAFLAQHPEVARNPTFYVGENSVRAQSDQERQDKMRFIQEGLVGLALFVFFMVALGVVTHMSRSILEHRRWLHSTRIQTDAHTKLLDRLGSNDELIAYVQSSAGQKFLAATPFASDPESRVAGTPAPVGRILTSVQVGIVAVCGGAGLWIAKQNIIEEVAQVLQVISILAIALGAGFVLSALLSWALSKQLGLLRSSSHA